MIHAKESYNDHDFDDAFSTGGRQPRRFAPIRYRFGTYEARKPFWRG
jgi:hypothetical protein